MDSDKFLSRLEIFEVNNNLLSKVDIGFSEDFVIVYDKIEDIKRKYID